MKHNITVQALTPHDEDYSSICAEHWKACWQAAGYQDFKSDWKQVTFQFFQQAQEAGLHPKTFVARAGDGDVMLGSINCQIWAGPIPWVVQPDNLSIG